MKTEEQLTAVEWLFNQLSLNNLLLNQGAKVHKEMEHKILEQAKEMEKEQIINAALYGFRRDSDGDDWQGDNYNAEKYYNTTFKLK